MALRQWLQQICLISSSAIAVHWSPTNQETVQLLPWCKSELHWLLGSEVLTYSPFDRHGDKEDKDEAEEKEERDDWGYWVCGSKLTSGIKCSCGIKWYCCFCYLVISYMTHWYPKMGGCCPNFNLQISPLWSLCDYLKFELILVINTLYYCYH